jgi:hypothetical protein
MDGKSNPDPHQPDADPQHCCKNGGNVSCDICWASGGVAAEKYPKVSVAISLPALHGILKLVCRNWRKCLPRHGSLYRGIHAQGCGGVGAGQQNLIYSP